ncbi:MAG: dihydrolipoyl dehydrogenase [Oscillospiraceae bacterium]|nr:dihydrolipoyl dehydrogenase [Oscillospiraceae bacterium]
MYDLIILGGGPAGYNAAERAGSNGLKTLLIEKRALGGVCLNEGCIPSKTLLYSAKLYSHALHSEKYGVYTEGAKINHAEVIARKDKIVKTLTSGIAASMKGHKVTVVYGEAKILGRVDGGFEVAVGDEKHVAAKLLICTGSEALVPPIDGLRDSVAAGFALTNREILALTELPEKLCIIGGGVIGLEMASYFNSVGTKVTVVEMMDRIAGQTDLEISNLLKDIYTSKGVDFRLGAKVVSVKNGVVEYEKDGVKTAVEADKVLVSIGRRANTAGIGLESIGVLTERGAIVTDEQMKTNVPGVFAAGDVNGKSMLAHTAYREGEVAVNNMIGIKDIMDYSAVPAVIYTDPEAASVGETEETAAKKGIEIIVKKLPMSYSGRYLAENEGGKGICKVILSKEGNRLLGVSMLANPAGEIITAATAMIGREFRAADVQRVIFPHPTVAEVIRESVF